VNLDGPTREFVRTFHFHEFPIFAFQVLCRFSESECELRTLTRSGLNAEQVFSRLLQYDTLHSAFARGRLCLLADEFGARND